ncbi:hypothetical protein BV408_24670 [Klebsiella pneumoniae]|nr:hypothetical protein BV408_24670 [Klebsiella pneumoniae]
MPRLFDQSDPCTKRWSFWWSAKFKKPAFEQAFCFFASLTLTQHRIQPGKHLVDNDVRYAFQTLAFPYRLPTPRVSSVNAPQLSLKKRLPVG